MNLEQLKALMPDASDDVLKSTLEEINNDAKQLVETETKGLNDNKAKLLDQMSKLKKNQVPEGYDAEGYNKYLSEKDELEKKQQELADKELEGKGQWEALKIKLSENHTNALENLKTETGSEIAGLKSALDKVLIENASMAAIEKEKGNSLFLLPHMKSQIKTVKGENGDYSVQVVDSEGNVRMSEDQSKPFTVNDLVAEYKANDAFSAAFQTQNSGGGGNPNGGGNNNSGGVNPWKSETKNVTEQARINKENPTLAAQYRKAAGVE